MQNKYIMKFLQHKEDKKPKSKPSGGQKGFERCIEHNREMNLFCQEKGCREIICSNCLLSEHKMHDVIDVNEHCFNIIKRINENIKEKYGSFFRTCRKYIGLKMTDENSRDCIHQ